jgi:hypothetical protein
MAVHPSIYGKYHQHTEFTAQCGFCYCSNAQHVNQQKKLKIQYDVTNFVVQNFLMFFPKVRRRLIPSHSYGILLFSGTLLGNELNTAIT